MTNSAKPGDSEIDMEVERIETRPENDIDTDQDIAQEIQRLVAKIRQKAHKRSEEKVSEAFHRLVKSIDVDLGKIPVGTLGGTVYDVLVGAKQAVIEHVREHEESSAISAFVAQLTEALSGKQGDN